MKKRIFYDADLRELADRLQYRPDEMERADYLKLGSVLRELQELRTLVDDAFRVSEREMYG